MKKSRLLGAVCACVIGFISTSTYAVGVSGQGTWETTLQGRDLDGNLYTAEAYYDTVLDITWLADANHAISSGYTFYPMNWVANNNWSANLDPYNSGIVGWRLPSVNDVGNNGRTYANIYQGVDWGYNIDTTNSELAHMYFDTLGNLAMYDTYGTERNCGTLAPNYCLSNTGPFSNIVPSSYGTSTAYILNTTDAWAFNFFSGWQANGYKSSGYYAWAVHDGDVGAAIVPVPAAQSAQLTYFAEDFTFLGGPGFERGMYNIDTTTGTYSLRTTVDRGCVQQNGYCTGFNMINGARFFSMDRRPSDGTVFAATFEPNDLYTVDIDSGAVNYIGSTLPTSVNSKQWQFTSLAFNPLTDELYGLSNDTLFLINQVDGTPTILGKLPTVNTGLAFSPQGELYGYDWSVSPNVHLSLYKVDLGTLTETLIGTTTGVNCSTVDATFTQGGSLYISGFCGDIYQTDLTTGTSILVVSGSQTGLVDGGMLALLPAAVPSPPVLEPFPWEIFMPAILHGAKARSLVP